MKTAISLPNEVFARVERHAQRLGISRSEFFATAAARMADELEAEEVTAAIDRALDDAGAAGTEDLLREASRRRLNSTDGIA
jgi:hypothetical protein